MKIVLSGVETNNKGAELMLYAILQEIERRWPKAKVYIPYSRCKQGLGYVMTNLVFQYTPYSQFAYKRHLSRWFRLLHIPLKCLWRFDIVKDADWFIDGSGFAFSDQWNIKDERVLMWQFKLGKLHDNDCKTVFLPQAFGPVEQTNTRKTLAILSKYASIIMPREKVSFNYLKQSGVVDMNKVRLYTDFTSLVEGTVPPHYEYLRNGICIIPNMKMIDKGTISYDDYIHLLTSFINEGRKTGRPVYLLNHEGPKDEALCYQCQNSVEKSIEVVTGLNALEVKGLISTAYLVVTSRFHGLASALNCCVPCLATSWSHKYEELYKDYGINGCILPLNNLQRATEMFLEHLDDSRNHLIRKHLTLTVPKIKEQTKEMWNIIWNQK